MPEPDQSSETSLEPVIKFPETPYPDYTELGWENPRRELIGTDSDGNTLYKYTLESGLQYPVLVDPQGKIAEKEFNLEADLGNGWQTREDDWFLSGHDKNGEPTLQAMVRKKIELPNGVVHEAVSLIDPGKRNLNFGLTSSDDKTIMSVTVHTSSRDNYNKYRKLEVALSSKNLITGHQVLIEFDGNGELASINLARLPVGGLKLDLTEAIQSGEPEAIGKKIGDEIGGLSIFGEFVDRADTERVRAIFRDTLGVDPGSEPPRVNARKTFDSLMDNINKDAGIQDPRRSIAFESKLENDIRFLS